MREATTKGLGASARQLDANTSGSSPLLPPVHPLVLKPLTSAAESLLCALGYGSEGGCSLRARDQPAGFAKLVGVRRLVQCHAARLCVDGVAATVDGRAPLPLVRPERLQAREQ